MNTLKNIQDKKNGIKLYTHTHTRYGMSKILQYVGTCWLAADHMTNAVQAVEEGTPTVIGCIVVAGVQTDCASFRSVCDLNAAQKNIQNCLI